jgi:hypothetical protein
VTTLLYVLAAVVLYVALVMALGNILRRRRRERR